MGTFRYKAFISYSHRDKDWSSWLQRSLERYRIPKRLVGTQGAFGAIPRRLTPVFRDREDLSSSSDLSAKVKECLASSEAMIVICSPASSQSIWVNEEVRYFRSLGREDHIFALIVDGDPQAESAAEKCFPAALIQDPDGAIREPLAADARKWADGKLLAKLKIISGILGIQLDELRRRDMQRRQRVWMASVGAAGAVAVAMTILAVMAITARDAAENRREHAEELVGYMVGDLKTKLDEVGRLDILEGMGGRVSDYLGTLDAGELTDESLIQQAQVWRQLGQVGMNQGDLTAALKAFTASRDVLAELNRRSPEKAEFLFELGNAEFWIGYVHLETGDFDLAEKAMAKYLGDANRLVEMEPGNPQWLMEKSYAHSNMAALNVERGGADTEGAVLHIQAAVELNRKVIEMEPGNLEYEGELGTALAWLADTQLLGCDLGSALVSRQESVAIAEKMAVQAPANANFKQTHAFALTGVANVALQVGLTDLALENFIQARDILGQMSIVDPSNVDNRYSYLMRTAFAAEVMAESGRLTEALVQMETIGEPLVRALEAESYANLKRHIEFISYLLVRSDMNWRSGDPEAAALSLSQAVEHLGRLLAREKDQSVLTDKLLTARFLYWQQRGEDLFENAAFSGIEIGSDHKDRNCGTKAGLVRQAIVTNDLGMARKLTDELLAKGYYEPGFIRNCREYELCQ